VQSTCTNTQTPPTMPDVNVPYTCAVTLRDCRFVAYRTLKDVPSRTLWPPAFWVAVLGPGSGLLHGTNRWLGQLMDEVPMLFWVVSWLVCMKGCHPWTTGRKGRCFYAAISLITFGAILAYVVFKRCAVPLCSLVPLHESSSRTSSCVCSSSALELVHSLVGSFCRRTWHRSS
jgi:hypothetical protein